MWGWRFLPCPQCCLVKLNNSFKWLHLKTIKVCFLKIFILIFQIISKKHFNYSFSLVIIKISSYLTMSKNSLLSILSSCDITTFTLFYFQGTEDTCCLIQQLITLILHNSLHTVSIFCIL